MSRSRDEIGRSVASVTGECSLHAYVSFCSDRLFFCVFRRLYDLFCRCVVRLIKVFFFPFYYMCACFTFSIFYVMLSALVIF